LAALGKFVTALPSVYPVDPKRMILLGFSQGAGMSYALTITQTRAAGKPPVQGVVGLSGFIPAIIGRDVPPLDGLPVLMLHGTEDTTIPIRIARENRDRLTNAGAKVTYQESEMGHKVSTTGMRELTSWLTERLASQPK